MMVENNSLFPESEIPSIIVGISENYREEVLKLIKALKLVSIL